MASLVACLLSQPGDMILTETYKPVKAVDDNNNNPIEQLLDRIRGNGAGEADAADKVSFGQVISNINGRGGVGEFFRGTQARIVHVGMIITSQLVIYDLVKQALGLPATGSH